MAPLPWLDQEIDTLKHIKGYLNAFYAHDNERRKSLGRDKTSKGLNRFYKDDYPGFYQIHEGEPLFGESLNNLIHPQQHER